MTECNWCASVWEDVCTKNPQASSRELAETVKGEILMTIAAANCKGKTCLPLKIANEVIKRENKNEHRKEGFFMHRAREVVENKILDEVKGHPDKYTAFESARKCGCNQCVSLYNSWIDLWGQGNPDYEKFKKPLHGAKHIED